MYYFEYMFVNEFCFYKCQEEWLNDLELGLFDLKMYDFLFYICIYLKEEQ